MRIDSNALLRRLKTLRFPRYFRMNLEIDIAPDNLESLLKSDIAAVGAEIVKELAELAPVEMRDLMGTSPSARGNPPGVKSGSLSRSLKGLNDEISMVYYAEFLDSFLGGNLERDFVLQGIDNALVKVARQL